VNKIVFDIETFSLTGAEAFIPEPEAPSNWKDPEKIAAFIVDATAKAVSRCALDPDLCQIVAIGIYDPEEAKESKRTTILLAGDETAERAALEEFWDRTHGCDFIGYNILDFDLPVLIRRSQYLGIDFRNTSVDRYRSNHIDLMQYLSWNGKVKYRSLDFYCRRFGIQVEDATTGKDIDSMVRANDWTGVADHCRCDLKKTRLLAERLGQLQPATTPNGELVF
jgi:DNA polymerase elongation subunit (family B)